MAPSDQDLQEWRHRIDELDRTLVRLLNERAEYALRIGAWKQERGMDVRVPGREMEVLQNAARWNTGPFGEEAIRRLFEQIIAETRALEQQSHESPTDPPDSTPMTP